MKRVCCVVMAACLAACAAPPKKITSDDGLVIISRVQPQYPRAAAENRVQGCVIVSFVVTDAGVADQFQILDSVPKGVFDQVTLKALAGWRFEPPARKGRYAQSLHYSLSSRGKLMERDCIPIPSFVTLNPAGDGKAL